MHIDQTNWLYINDDQGKVYKNCNFIIHKAGVLVLRRSHISHTVKMHYFLNTFLCSQAYKRHSEYKNKDDHGMVYQNCKFNDPLAGVLVLGLGHISHSLKCLISWKIYFILPSIDQTNWVYSNATQSFLSLPSNFLANSPPPPSRKKLRIVFKLIISCIIHSKRISS